MQRHDVATFKAQGFVVVRGLVPTEQIDAWRDQAWSAMDIEPSDVPRLGYAFCEIYVLASNNKLQKEGGVVINHAVRAKFY